MRFNRPLTIVKKASDSEELKSILNEMESLDYRLASVMSTREGTYIVTFIDKDEFEKD